jgi:hypothetical protein
LSEALCTTFEYQLWGHRVVSDFDLGELEPAPAGGLQGILRVSRASEKGWTPPESDALLEARLDNGDLWFASWSAGGSYLARFPKLCSFRICPERMHIECAPEPGVAESTIAHIILDHALPRLFSVRSGYMVLHASAVQAEDRVIAVLGQSGLGKSTLAAWFASQGFPILTDDCLVLRWDEAARQWMALPSYQSVRLWPDSVEALGIEASSLREFAGYSSKRRTGREVDYRFVTGGAPLKACFVLAGATGSGVEHCGAPEIRPLTVNESFLALAQAAFRLDAGDAQINRREFEALTELADTAGFWSLAYERKYSWLPDVQRAIMQAIQAR